MSGDLARIGNEELDTPGELVLSCGLRVSRLKAQLDRIEETLSIVVRDHGPQQPYTRMPERCGYHDWTGDWGRLACVKCGTPMEAKR